MDHSASVVISLDAELAWGHHDMEPLTTRHRQRIQSSRAAWSWLVDRLDHHEVPATWAVVGHLFLESCDGTHADHPLGEDWFRRDTGGSESTAPAWFGRSLIEAVLDSDVDHEVGCHTFSHVEMSSPAITAHVADAELERCIALAEEWGLSLSSFVFPRNEVGHRDRLAAHDFSCYRGTGSPPWFETASLRPAAKLAAYIRGEAPPLVEPRVDEYGLVDIPASQLIYSFEGKLSRVLSVGSGDPVVRRVRHGLNSLRQHEGIMHLWLHPNNIISAADRARMESILETVATYREAYGIPVETMGGVAERVT